jgi:hypothetical protein
MTTAPTLPEIRTQLSALVAAMSAKGLIQPESEYRISADSDDKVILRSKKVGKAYDWHYDYFASIEAARDWIAALPTADEKVLTDYTAKIADAIDFATLHSLPDDIVTPLRTVRTTIYENLLPAPAA